MERKRNEDRNCGSRKDGAGSGRIVRQGRSRGVPVQFARPGLPRHGDLGPRSRAANVEECVESSEVVVLATPWGKTADAVGAVDPWAGKIVIDTTNNRRAPGPDGVIDIGDAVSSELVAEMVPGARLVKAFNATPIPMMIAALQSGDARNAIYIAADDALAKSTVATLISSIGGEAVDVGDLHSGGALIGTSGPLPGTLEMLTPECR